MTRHLSIAACAALLALAGCRADQALEPPASASTYDGLFARYVSLGNSIAAGFQSGGINDSTQQQAFPVLIAEAIGTPFAYPSLAGRGCPAPYTNNVTRTRVGDQPPVQPCDLRVVPPPPYLNNLAVPGLHIADAFSNTASGLGTYSRLTQFFLGGLTEIQWLMREDPTFVTVEIGPNDVLGPMLAANPGDLALLTPLSSFESQYRELGDSIAATGASAALMLIPDVTLIPFASAGSAYWCIKNQPACGFTVPAAFPPTFTVDNNCAPSAAIPSSEGDSVLVPFPIGLAKIAAAAAGAPTTLNCALDAEVVLPSELSAIRAAVVANNVVIADVASDHGWALVDPNPTFAAAKADGSIPSFPDLSQALSGGNVSFGPYFSLDGFHPSAAGQRVLANLFIAAINAQYGLAIPLVN